MPRDRQCGPFPRENPNPCVPPEVPPATLAEPVWHAPPPPQDRQTYRHREHRFFRECSGAVPYRTVPAWLLGCFGGFTHLRRPDFSLCGRSFISHQCKETIQACQTCFGCRLALVLPVTHVPPTVSQSQILLRKALSRCPLTLNSQPTNCQTGGGRRGWGREASP